MGDGTGDAPCWTDRRVHPATGQVRRQPLARSATHSTGTPPPPPLSPPRPAAGGCRRPTVAPVGRGAVRARYSGGSSAACVGVVHHRHARRPRLPGLPDDAGDESLSIVAVGPIFGRSSACSRRGRRSPDRRRGVPPRFVPYPGERRGLSRAARGLWRCSSPLLHGRGARRGCRDHRRHLGRGGGGGVVPPHRGSCWYVRRMAVAATGGPPAAGRPEDLPVSGRGPQRPRATWWWPAAAHRSSGRSIWPRGGRCGRRRRRPGTQWSQVQLARAAHHEQAAPPRRNRSERPPPFGRRRKAAWFRRGTGSRRGPPRGRGRCGRRARPRCRGRPGRGSSSTTGNVNPYRSPRVAATRSRAVGGEVGGVEPDGEPGSSTSSPYIGRFRCFQGSLGDQVDEGGRRRRRASRERGRPRRRGPAPGGGWGVEDASPRQSEQRPLEGEITVQSSRTPVRARTDRQG